MQLTLDPVIKVKQARHLPTGSYRIRYGPPWLYGTWSCIPFTDERLIELERFPFVSQGSLYPIQQRLMGQLPEWRAGKREDGRTRWVFDDSYDVILLASLSPRSDRNCTSMASITWSRYPIRPPSPRTPCIERILGEGISTRMPDKMDLEGRGIESNLWTQKNGFT